MKKILGSVGAIAVIGVLSYPGFGFLVEKGLKRQINAMPKQYGMTVELKDFQRHWFSSDAKLFWKWDIPAHLKQNLQGQTITVSPQHYEKEIDIQIFHGPLVLKGWKPFLGVGYASTTFKWPFSTTQNNDIEFSKESIFPQVTVRMALDFLMHTHWKTEVPEFKLIAKDNSSKINWGGLVLKNTISTNLDKVQGNVDLKALEIIKPQGAVNINSFKTNYDFNLNPVGIYVGDAELNLDKIELGKELRMDAVRVKNQAEIQNNLFSSSFDASLKSANINGYAFGPFEADFKITQINAAALAKAKESLHQQQNASPSFRNKGFLALISAIPELLKFGAQFNVDKFHLSLQNGTIDSHVQLNLPADEKSGAMLNIARLQSLTGQADLDVSATLLKDWLIDLVQKQIQSQQQLSLEPTAPMAAPSTEDIHQIASVRTTEKMDALVKAGVIAQKGEHYIFNLKLQNGQLTINDLPFDPSWLVI
jgi:uncharacterized protein YdgA (DUF945 family)